MKSESLVSVIIPTHNRKDYVAKAINSVLAQTYKNVEIIIIDDGSSDGTYDFILEGYKKYPSIIILKNDKNLGFVKTLKRGIDIAKGKYIARLDDDDLWINIDKIGKQVTFLENNKDYVLVGSGAIKTNGSSKGNIKYLPPADDGKIRKLLLISNVFIHSSVVFPREAYQKAGGYNEYFGFFADWELWLNLGRFGKLYNFQDFFVSYKDQEETSNNSHDIYIRRNLIETLKMKKKYRTFYYNYSKAILFAFLSFLYSFLPLRTKMLGFKNIFKC